MGICVSHEPQKNEIRNRAKNCSLLYRPIDTSPYINVKPSLSGKSTHLHAHSLLNGQNTLDDINISKSDKDMLKLDLLDDPLWKTTYELLKTDSQGKYVTEELINYEIKALRVQMAKSQAIIAALTQTPQEDIDIDWLLSEDNNNTHLHKHCQNSHKLPFKNHVPNSIAEVMDSNRNIAETRLPSFLFPHSQTQSFDHCQENDNVQPNNGCKTALQVNRSMSCPDLSPVLKRLTTRLIAPVLVTDINGEDSNRKRSCSYLAAIQQGQTQKENSSATEEIQNDCNRKLSILPEDDRESLCKPKTPSPTTGWKGELAKPPPYRCPPSPINDQTKDTVINDSGDKQTETPVTHSKSNGDLNSVIITDMKQHSSQVKQKAQSGASDIAFQRRAGFSFRRRPGQAGTPTPNNISQLPTIKRSSAIEVEDSSPVSEVQSTVKQTTSSSSQKPQQPPPTTQGLQQLSVEMETSETESAKGSMESEYDVPGSSIAAVVIGTSCGQSLVSNESVNDQSETDQLTEKIMRINANQFRTDNLTDEEIENHFQHLYLAFNNSKVTIKKRLEAHQRQRDLAETNVTKELEQLKVMMRSAITVSQNGNSLQKKEMATSLQQQLDILQQMVQRLSSRAEIYGATEQEEKMCKAADIMVQYVCNTKKKETKLQKELDDTKRVMDRAAALGLGHHAKTILSQRESNSGAPNVPNLGRRRASLCVVPRTFSAGSGAAAGAQHLPLACTCRQTMEEGDQLLKTKLRCPLHSGSNKRRSISVFNPPNVSQLKNESSRSNSTSFIRKVHEQVSITDKDEDSKKNAQQSENIQEKLWTPEPNSNGECNLQPMRITEIDEDNCDDSESCLDDDLHVHADELQHENTSDDDDSNLNSEYVKCQPECRKNQWIELLTLAKNFRTKKRSDSFHEFGMWWKRSTDAVQLIRYTISGFLVMMAMAFIALSFIRPTYFND